MIWAVTIFVDGVLSPVIDIDVAKATHQHQWIRNLYPYFCERKELKSLTSRKAFICFCTLLTNRHWMTRLQKETKPHQKTKLISRSQPSVQKFQQPQVLSVSHLQLTTGMLALESWLWSVTGRRQRDEGQAGEHLLAHLNLSQMLEVHLSMERGGISGEQST
ncbi:hypothetical protein DV515_00014711 [Chloebia gouldiae]|uniref:Uncharacterized protein n=1 Tax=Chloebia gouldiae TaxID=44316 RepID=A0A3L8RXM5_CHLGU|nr:hypothetical protein DV515_00014711 [Chloebia gouldiae]